jgi:hypothetical protein
MSNMPMKPPPPMPMLPPEQRPATRGDIAEVIAELRAIREVLERIEHLR